MASPSLWVLGVAATQTILAQGWPTAKHLFDCPLLYHDVAPMIIIIPLIRDQGYNANCLPWYELEARAMAQPFECQVRRGAGYE
jgi:hypothetical protein